MEKKGVLRRYQPGQVVSITAGTGTGTGTGAGTDSGSGTSAPPRMHPVEFTGGAQAFYSVGGMNNFVGELASGLEIKQNVWVSPSNGVKYLRESGRWEVRVKGRVAGTYDALVIAHNGKCADRLMSQAPPRQLHALLRTNFAPKVADSGGSKMTLNSIYSTPPFFRSVSGFRTTFSFLCGSFGYQLCSSIQTR